MLTGYDHTKVAEDTEDGWVGGPLAGGQWPG
jgi:hypothetical protein